MRSALFSGIQFALLALAVSFPLYSHAADCPPGTAPASAQDVPVMKQAGILGAFVGMCWDKSDASVGQAAGEAKIFLQQHATKNSNISCLNSTFAERLKNLMQAAPGGPPTIRDGYRSPQAQANLPRGSTRVGPCGSYHQYGMAADFNASEQTLRWMRVNAAQFGLSPVTNANPVTGCTARGFCDGGHIQIAGPKPPRNQCGMCATETGDGVLPGVQGTPYPDDYYGEVANNPVSAISDFIRQALGMQQQQPLPQQPAPTQPQQSSGNPAPIGTPNTPAQSSGQQQSSAQSPDLQSSSPTACIPSYSCSGDNYLYQTSSCSTIVVQKCPYGCAGDTCALSPTTSGVHQDSSGTSGNPSSSNGLAIDLIQAIANPQPLEIGTATPIILNPDIGEIAGPMGGPPGAGNQISPPDASILVPPGTQETFTSADLANSPPLYRSQNTFALGILENLKQVLIGALNYLKPFGGITPPQMYAE